MKQWVFASMTAVVLGLVAIHPVARAADKGTIEGRVFEDKDGDGIRDAGEKGLEGVKVKLSGKLKRTEETDKNGKFSFADLADGDYDVTVTLEKDWVAVKDFTAYKDLQVEGATLSDVDFALQDKADAAASADKADATSTAENTATEAPTTKAAATKTPAAEATADTAVAGAATEATAEDEGDEDKADKEGAEGESSMDDAAAKLVAGLSGSDLDPTVVAALQKALADTKAAGGQSDVTKAMEAALATLPKDVREQAAAAATDIAAKDKMASDKSTKETASAADAPKDQTQMTPAAGTQPANSMPETGGGTLALGALLAAALAALGGAGRLMERRRA